MITEDMVRSALKNVYDPEIGVDVVNLGLIYKIDVYDQGKKVDVDMTLTTPACPAGPQILEQARRAAQMLIFIKQRGDSLNRRTECRIVLLYRDRLARDYLLRSAVGEHNASDRENT